MTEILSSLLHESDADEIADTVNLSLGQLEAKYKGIVFNIADKLMLQAISKAFKKAPDIVLADYKRVGDLGDVVYEYSNKKEDNLSVSEVKKRLLLIADDEGGGSQERKVGDMAKLLENSGKLSGRYLVRIPLGKLRLGFSDKTIIDALSWMIVGDKSKRKQVEMAYEVLPDIALLAEKIKKYGIDKATKDISPEVGIPVLPMLAQRLKSPSDMISKMGEVSVEPKLDGLRILIHFKRGKSGFVKAYTRNMNETSWMFPELMKISSELSANEIILDTEAVGVDEERQKSANFQSTMTRRRKHDIEKYSKSVPIKFFVFDILYKDGRNMMGESYLDRRKVLAKTVDYSKILAKVEYTITNSSTEIASLNKYYRNKGFEGIMIKNVQSNYVPGRTGWRWVKMKEAEDSPAKLSDTVDGLVLGYTRGKGKRAGFGLGQFLVGVRDGDLVKTVTKVGTGLTDELFKDLNTKLTKLAVSEKPINYDVHKNYFPDIWVKPELVVEIAADEITKSPTHTSGYALRFPRLIKVRNDKGLSDVTSIDEIVALMKLQN